MDHKKMIIKTTKSGKVRCPVCDKSVLPYEDDDKNVMILDCCKVWSLFPLETQAAQPKKRIKKNKSNAELLNKLKDHHFKGKPND